MTATVPEGPDVAAAATLRADRRWRRTRRLRTSTALVVVTVGVVLLALTLGEYPLRPGEVAAALVGQGEEAARLVLWEFRLPRLLLAVLVGAAFGLSGALFQSVLRNPLASPDIIGVTQGASVGAVGASLALGLTGAWVSGLALAGGLGVAGVTVLLAWRGGLTGHRFVLCGIALAFVAQSVIGYLLTRSDVREAQTALLWLTGSVGAADYATIARVALPLVVLVPLALALGPVVGVLELGEETATALGAPAGSTRLLALVVGTALAATATAAAGPVAFVALTAAPVARRLVGDGRPALGQSALTGVVVLVAADVLAQHVMPVEVPVGIVTGLVGGPYLIWIIASVQRPRRTP